MDTLVDQYFRDRQSALYAQHILEDVRPVNANLHYLLTVLGTESFEALIQALADTKSWKKTWLIVLHGDDLGKIVDLHRAIISFFLPYQYMRIYDSTGRYLSSCSTDFPHKQLLLYEPEGDPLTGDELDMLLMHTSVLMECNQGEEDMWSKTDNTLHLYL